MVIILTGGGSGGHITPLLAVADELKKQRPDCQLIYIGQRGDKLADIPSEYPSIDTVYTVRAGKFRRYHGEGLHQLLDIKTLLKNFRDFFFVFAGLWQSYRLLKKLKPNGIFIKGGFVSLPVGLAAAFLHIPYITHDSDAIPGLTNRIISRWARLHAVSLPKEIYKYPANKTVTVGVPIGKHFLPVTKSSQASYKEELGLGNYKQVIFITGGGLGAQRLNEVVAQVMPELLKNYPDLVAVHAVGRDHKQSMRHLYDKNLATADMPRVIIKGFIDDLYRYSGAADVIITRAGATNLAEFAAQSKACVIVPNPQLTGGHQVKNAQALAAHKAAIIIQEQQLIRYPETLSDTISRLLDHPSDRQQLGHRLSQFAYLNATEHLAQLILSMVS